MNLERTEGEPDVKEVVDDDDMDADDDRDDDAVERYYINSLIDISRNYFSIFAHCC